MAIRTDVTPAPAVVHFLRMAAGQGRHRTRYIIVDAAGAFYDKNDYGKATTFACYQWGTAVRYARQKRGPSFIVSLDAAGQPVVQDLETDKAPLPRHPGHVLADERDWVERERGRDRAGL